MIKIDKNVPIPARGYASSNAAKYPWHELEPGDSFFIPGKSVKQVSSSVGWAKKRFGIRLTARSENGGTRVWRLPDDDGKPA